MREFTRNGNGGAELGPEATREFEAPAKIISKKLIAKRVVELLLVRKDGSDWPKWDPGSHIDLILPDGTIRQYSLCGNADERERLRICVLREEKSRGGSSYIHDILQVNSEVNVRGPRNNFELLEHDQYIFIAGGIGITPIAAMVQVVNAKGMNWTLHYGGRDAESMALVSELAATRGEVYLYPQDKVGPIPLSNILRGASDGTGVYVCGPAPLLAAIDEYRTYWPKGAIKTERFSTNALQNANNENQEISVTLASSGIEVTVRSDQSILEVVESHGIQILSSCREGTCGTCETPVIAGVPDHRDSVLDEEERELGECMMICVSRAKTPRLILDL